jgi:hypothetical protein
MYCTVQRDNSVYRNKLRKLKNIEEWGLKGGGPVCTSFLDFVDGAAAGKLCTDSHGNDELLLVNSMKSTGFAKLQSKSESYNLIVQ